MTLPLKCHGTGTLQQPRQRRAASSLHRRPQLQPSKWPSRWTRVRTTLCQAPVHVSATKPLPKLRGRTSLPPAIGRSLKQKRLQRRRLRHTGSTQPTMHSLPRLPRARLCAPRWRSLFPGPCIARANGWTV